MSFSVPNPIGKDEAITKLKKLLPLISAQYSSQIKDLEESWDENVLSFSFKTMGLTIAGTVTAEEEQVDFQGDLPFAAMMFKGQIEKTIREQLEKLLT